MAFIARTRAAACVAAILVAAGTLAVRAQDSAAPAGEAPAEAAQAAPAEPQRNPTDVVARVGDQTITEAELEMAREQFGPQLQQVPGPQQRSVLIDALVNMKLLAQAARDANLDEGEEFERRREFLELQALRQAYVEEVIVGGIMPEELQNAYETLVVAQHQPAEQIRARHILVDTEEQAAEIIAELEGGASFEELAKQSKDPSGQNGGDLGFFSRGQMVPAFEEAAFALEPGAITEAPVQTQFGWHVIKLEEKRMSEPPTFAEAEDQLRLYVLREKFETTMASLRDRYGVEIVGQPAAAPETETPPAAGGEAPAAAPAGEEQPQN